MLKKIVTRGIRNGERGYVFIVTLVFLMVGALLIVPLLQFMGTGVKSGGVFGKKTTELYAADAGIEDAVWMAKYADRDSSSGIFSLTSPKAYNEYDYSTVWHYDLPGTVNGKHVSVSVKNEWIPRGIDEISTVPDPTEAASVAASNKLRVNGSLTAGSSYRIRIDYDAQPGEELRVESIGIWLPDGFHYVMGSSNLEDPYQPYHSTPTVTPYAGGELVIWHYNSFIFGDLPPAGTTESAVVTFNYTSEVAGRDFTTISWIDTYNALPNGIVIPYAWDTDTNVFSVTSTADGTVVDSTLYLSGRYSSLLYNAITSPTSVVTQPGTTINGTIECPSEGFDPPAAGDWEWMPYDEEWPVVDEWRQFFLDDVAGVSLYSSNTIDLSNYTEPAHVGPIVRQGNLTIDKSSTGGASTLVLDGTMYISGNLLVAQSGSKDFSIDLNYNTIFVGGTVNIASASTFVGSGSIISVGAFTFQPMMASGTNDFLFVCSLNDYVQFQPNGNFSGSVAGIVNCQLQPGNSVTWNPPPGNLNLPGMDEGDTGGFGSRVNTYAWNIE